MREAGSICILETNPASGMIDTHGRLCGYGCGDAAIQHVRIGGWCANICGGKACEHRAAGGIFTAKLMGLKEDGR